MEQLVENISDTARWVAIYRARESERPDAVFHDPFARQLAGEKGEQMANAITFMDQNSWSLVARTYLFDQFIQQHVDAGFDMVINLAAGLDARPYRMPLPASLQWIDVDLPGILNYKQSILANEKPVCQYRSITLDLTDLTARRDLFEQLNKESKKALMVSEGLIIYLPESDVVALAEDLSAQPNFQRWVLDLQSPMLLAMTQKEMGEKLKEGNAVFRFAPENGEDFFIPHGWKPLAAQSKLKTAGTLNRLPDHIKEYASMPEPPGPNRQFPWSGVCLLENAVVRVPRTAS